MPSTPTPDHRISARDEHVHTSWSRDHEPIRTVESGDVIRFECRDATNGRLDANSTVEDVSDLAGTASGHPLTGPVAVEGAKPGDVLAVELLSFEHEGIGFTYSYGGEQGTGLLPRGFLGTGTPRLGTGRRTLRGRHRGPAGPVSGQSRRRARRRRDTQHGPAPPGRRKPRREAPDGGVNAVPPHRSRRRALQHRRLSRRTRGRRSLCHRNRSADVGDGATPRRPRNGHRTTAVRDRRPVRRESRRTGVRDDGRQRRFDGCQQEGDSTHDHPPPRKSRIEPDGRVSTVFGDSGPENRRRS